MDKKARRSSAELKFIWVKNGAETFGTLGSVPRVSYPLCNPIM